MENHPKGGLGLEKGGFMSPPWVLGLKRGRRWVRREELVLGGGISQFEAVSKPPWPAEPCMVVVRVQGGGNEVVGSTSISQHNEKVTNRW